MLVPPWLCLQLLALSSMMTIQASKFTPEVLLSAPRRSSAVPNPSGNKALYTVSSYSFQTHSKTSQIRVIDVHSGHSTLLYEDGSYSEPTWISDKDILFFKSGDKGSTSLMLGHSGLPQVVQEIRNFDGSLSNLKAYRLSDEEVAIVCSAPTTLSGAMYHPSSESKALSSAKTYSTLYARHWDAWQTENRNSLWYGLLKKKGGSYELQGPGLVNALDGTKLECPVPPFGGTADFDIGRRSPRRSLLRLTRVKTGNLQGYAAAPVFSHDGKQVAFTKMKSKQYESDKPRLLLIPDIAELTGVQEFYVTKDEVGGWDARPEWITWSKDDKELYVAAEKHGRVRLWKLPSSPEKAVEEPESIFEKGSIIEARLLPGSGKLLVSSNSQIESSLFSVLDPSSKKLDYVSSSSKHGKTFGLSEKQLENFWFKGAEGYDVQALVVKPSDFDEKKNTRWNPAIFAEQGYIAVMPNPVGSTGYGQNHTDAIQSQWGGLPYVDLVKCFEHIEKNLDYVDIDRAVALGASYGGYMINWIQGNELGRKFKALVCHDGVFSTLNQWSTEELFFPLHDFGGPIWENRATYEKWDPATKLANWSTPQLVIHNELDYRLPISEGLAMFNVLQARGVPSRFLMFPDENHWVLKPENSLVWHKEVLGWINKYSGVSK
ncbi:dipeptidyl-peptidase V [Verticillium alfalfae VaMs.102]|uniref:Dipeptidyl-peptidase V n=1 Tax=Verticillium alfalfae (strain VaMs.102 / ATCC MYA-4576 / FGSC 10136) TaxID=526221 RepID=C9SII6_VERA1|nr:dipeptidyl-peptidase V [Verticillium alfalfae VaMs.102]EEY18759.1 dipeptidyl-peptidase V [Verticillium alfalfae VaMs.102]